MQTRQLLALSLVPVLAACGGGGASSLGGGNLPGPAGFNALILEAEALSEKGDAPGFGPSESLPTENGVVYDGVMIAATDFEAATEGYLGDFTATVDFTDGDMTGTGSGFFLSGVDGEGEPDTPGTPVAGEITVTSDTVGLGDFDVTLSGTLFVEGLERTINSGAGFGGFGGDNGDVLAGGGLIGFGSTDTTLGILFLAD